jgi:hypothetical protein
MLPGASVSETEQAGGQMSRFVRHGHVGEGEAGEVKERGGVAG